MPWKERARIKIGTRKLTSKSEAASILDVRNPAAEGEFHLGESTLLTSFSVSYAFSRSRENEGQLAADKELLSLPPAPGNSPRFSGLELIPTALSLADAGS